MVCLGGERSQLPNIHASPSSAAPILIIISPAIFINISNDYLYLEACIYCVVHYRDSDHTSTSENMFKHVCNVNFTLDNGTSLRLFKKSAFYGKRDICISWIIFDVEVLSDPRHSLIIERQQITNISLILLMSNFKFHIYKCFNGRTHTPSR